MLINMFKPYLWTNLVTLAWKMSSGMPRKAGSLNGPLCTYLMRQNLHDQTRSRCKGNKCPCQVWKWSVKNYGRESINRACLPCRPPSRTGDDNTPQPLSPNNVCTVVTNAETVHNKSTYIISFLTWHNESINDDKNNYLYTWSTWLIRSFFVLLMMSKSIADDVTMTRQFWSDHMNNDI